MLSAESAAGRYPLESVTMQQLVINKVENEEVFRRSLDRFALENMQHDKHRQHSKVAGKNDVGGMMASTAAAISLAARQVSDSFSSFYFLFVYLCFLVGRIRISGVFAANTHLFMFFFLCIHCGRWRRFPIPKQLWPSPAPATPPCAWPGSGPRCPSSPCAATDASRAGWRWSGVCTPS